MVLGSYVGAALAANVRAKNEAYHIITRHSGILLAGIQLCLCLNSLRADLFALSLTYRLSLIAYRLKLTTYHLSLKTYHLPLIA